MKKINIYFGKQQDTFLGSYADTVSLMIEKDKEVDRLIDIITTNKQEYFGFKTPTGFRYIHVPKILWFDVDEIKDTKDGLYANGECVVDNVKGDNDEKSTN